MIQNHSNRCQKLLSDIFHMAARRQIRLKDTRDTVRYHLHGLNPRAFSYSRNGADVEELAYILMNDTNANLKSLVICEHCHKVWRKTHPRLGQIMNISHVAEEVSIKNIVEKRQRKVLSELCERCKENKIIVTKFQTNPHIFVITLTRSNVHINRLLMFNIGDTSYKFKLKGIVYFGEFHFTCIIFDVQFNCLYHDRMTTESRFLNIGHLNDLKDLNTYKNREARLVMYILE